MARLTQAVEQFCRPPAYVARHMGVHPSHLTDVVTLLEDKIKHLQAVIPVVEAAIEWEADREHAPLANAVYRLVQSGWKAEE